MSGFDNDVMWADNVDFRGIDPPSGQVTSNGELLIGSGSAPNIRVGTLTEPSAGINITNGAGSITFSLADDLNALENLGTTGLASRTALNTWSTSSITDNAVLIGDGGELVQNVGPLTDGQLVIGSTGVTPVAANLTEGTNIDIVNGAGTITIHAVGTSPGVSNIGFDYNSGTGVFSITAADGTALSATNKGYVTIWSKESSNPGQLVTVEITSNVSFIDDTGASEIAGNLFGTTAGVAYAQDMPFWVSAVLNDAENAIAFCLTRNGGGLTSPAAANIGAPDDAVADAQNDYWAFDNLDETLFDGNPSMPIGVIYMRKSAGDDWTVQGLYASASGINFPSSNWVSQNYTENFTVPTAHFGAATGSHMVDNGGTAPTFTTDNMRFQVDSQICKVYFHMTGNTATDGAGAVTAQIALPYTAGGTTASGSIIYGTGYVICPAYTGMVMFEVDDDTLLAKMRDINGNLLQNQDFSDGNRTIEGQLVYRTGANP